MTTAHFKLDRFVNAQAGAKGTNFATALAELKAGQKRSHWIWYVFPQLCELGRSELAKLYGIGSLNEARAYLAHLVLGARLQECVMVLLGLPESRTAEGVFGAIDALKLRSSLTLFIAAGAPPSFQTLLDRWYDGEVDAKTLAVLNIL